MFESKLAVTLRPQMLDKFEESKTTVEMIEKAIEKGYALSSKTPDFLFKYEAIIDLLLKTHDNLFLFEKHLDTMMTCETRRKELTLFYAEHCSKLKHVLRNEYFSDYIDETPKNADFIQCYLRLDYLRKHPDYVYSKDFKLENYFLNDELFEFLESINVDFNRMHRGCRGYGFTDLIRRFPRILKARAFRYDLSYGDPSNTINEMIEEGIIGIDDLPDYLLDDNRIVKLILSDPSLLDKYPEYKDKLVSYRTNLCIERFVADLPESLKHLESISFAYNYPSVDMELVKQAIKDSGFLITNCNWRDITSDVDLMMEQVRRNPNVLNTCFNVFGSGYELSDEHYKEIMNIIEKSGITLFTKQHFYSLNKDFMNFVVKNNPQFLNNMGKQKTNYSSDDELLELFDGEINPGSLPFGRKFDEGIVDAIKMNPHNYYALLGVYEDKDYAFDAYLAYVEAGLSIHDAMSWFIVPDHNYARIEKLRNGFDLPTKQFLDGHDTDAYHYPLYYVANYPELIEIKEKNSYFHIKPGGDSNNVYRDIGPDELRSDFSNYNLLKKDLTEEELLRICEMYYANKDNIMVSESTLLKNNYIYINEVFANNPSASYFDDLTEEQIIYFNKMFKEKNAVVNDNNFYYLRDFDLICDFVVKNNGIINLDYSWLSDEQKNRIDEILREVVVKGKAKLSNLPNSFVLNNYEFLKKYYDVHSLIDKVKYSFSDIELLDIFNDGLKNNYCVHSIDFIESLDEDVIRKLLNKDITLYHFLICSKDNLSERLLDIVGSYDYKEPSYEIKDNLTKEQLDEFLKFSPTSVEIFRYYYSKNLISKEVYHEYYKKCLENIKNGYNANDIAFDKKIELPIDYELINFLIKNNRKLCVGYLESYYDNEREFVFEFISNNYDKFRDYSRDIVNFLNLEDLQNLINNHNDFLDKDNFYSVLLKGNKVKGPQTDMILYEWWKLAGRPLGNSEYLDNFYIAKDIIDSGDLVPESYQFHVKNPIVNQMLYEYFKNNGKFDITDSALFYRNPLLLLEYLGREIPNPPPFSIDRKELVKMLLEVAKDKPAFFKKMGYYYDIDEMAKEDPLGMMYLMPYENSHYLTIVNALREKGHQFDETTPAFYMKDPNVLLQMLQNDNDRILFVLDFIEKNNVNIYGEVKDYISKIIVERCIPGYAKYVSYYDLNDYIIECLDKDFSSINQLNGISLRMEVLKHIFTIAVDKIKGGEYVIDENTPEFLFYSDEIRAIARDINPRLLDNVEIERLDRARDYSLIEYAISNPTKVDEIFVGVSRNFPEDLVNQLVDKLISNNYQVNDKTPQFLLCNYKFMYHLLKNGISVDEKYVRNFVTFENYHKLKDKELFTDLISRGYDAEFRGYIVKFGLETTLELASKYGYLLNLVNLSNIRLVDDIPFMLVDNDSALDVFDRVDDFDDLLNGLEIRGINTHQATARLMKKYIKDVVANKDKITALIKNGFTLYGDDIEALFMNDPVLFEIFIANTTSEYYLCRLINGSDPEKITPELMMLAIENGYKIDSNTPEHIRTNSIYVYNIIIKYGVDEVTKMVNSFKDIALNQEIINKLFEKGYEINENTPEAILSNITFLVSYFNKCNYSSRFRTGMKLVDESVYKELLYNMDINKMVLYFKELVPNDVYEEFVMNFTGIAESKRDVLVKLLCDGKRLNDTIRTSYERYILEHIGDIKFEDMDKVIDCLVRISESNSGEIRQFANTLVQEVLKLDDYEAAFNKIEEIFLQDYLPTVTKLFLVFKVLHKDYSAFTQEKLSVVLKNSTDAEKDAVIYKDLITSAFRSNNRSLLEYLHDLDEACRIVEEYETNREGINQDKLNKALMFLIAIINSSYVKNHDDKVVKLTNNYDSLIELLNNTYSGINLRDAIIKDLFDFDSYEEAIKYISECALETDRRNRARANGEFTLEEGDYVKGIGDAAYLTNILQNGSVSREFLGEAAGSDMTPLDTDLCRVTVPSDTLGATISSTAAAGYGEIYFVLKDGERFSVTRTKDGEDKVDLREAGKLESFHTAVWDGAASDHYGIRTGFASSEIDFIVAEDKKVQLEVALNGFYIPIVDRNGKLIFTPDDYDRLREKMSGIEYYGSGPFIIAEYEDLMAPGVQELAAGVSENRIGIKLKHNAIKASIARGMKSVGVTMKDKLDGNVMTGFADLIDTGSTARGTDLPGKADFDYICRVDRSLINDPKKFDEFKKAIRAQFVSVDNEEYVGPNGNFRLKGVVVDGLDEKVDIDLSFVIRTTKLNISSDESLLTRMDAIEQGNYVVRGEQGIDDPKTARNLVTGNILMAKKLLKAYKCYKKSNSPEKQGGLGGIGIENWILQHGGSLKNAAEDFMRVARSSDSYEEFKHNYTIWDFGQNHYSLEGSNYTHDNFVWRNMDADGYERMKAALATYLKYGEKALDPEISEEIVKEVNRQISEGEKVDINSFTI